MTERVYRSRSAFPWWIGLLTGLLFALAGVLLVLSPLGSASSIIALCIGVALIAGAVGAFTRRGGASIAAGVALLVLGLLAIALPRFVAGALVSFGGLLLIALGVLMLVFGSRLGAIVVVPAVVLLLGGVVAFIWPGVILTIVAVCGGIGMIVLGISLCVRSFRMRKTEVSETTIVLD